MMHFVVVILESLDLFRICLTIKFEVLFIDQVQELTPWDK